MAIHLVGLAQQLRLRRWRFAHNRFNGLVHGSQVPAGSAGDCFGAGSRVFGP
jgi:hypothetical protein